MGIGCTGLRNGNNNCGQQAYNKPFRHSTVDLRHKTVCCGIFTHHNGTDGNAITMTPQLFYWIDLGIAISIPVLFILLRLIGKLGKFDWVMFRFNGSDITLIPQLIWLIAPIIFYLAAVRVRKAIAVT